MSHPCDCGKPRETGDIPVPVTYLIDEDDVVRMMICPVCQPHMEDVLAYAPRDWRRELR